MEKIMDFMSGVKMTIVSGIFLVISLVLMLTNTNIYVDPAWVTIVISGLPLMYAAITKLVFKKQITSALLITIAMIASIIIDETFAAGEVAFIMAIGEILEDVTVSRAKKGVGTLLSLTPKTGRLILENTERVVPVTQIKSGDLLRILPGEIVPTDGMVLSGNTSIDQSIMTGESLPVEKEPNDNVFCGTINCNGAIDVTVTQTGKDSSLQKMIDLVTDAEKKKAPMQKIVDKWAAWLVPIALIIAIVSFIITKDITKSVTVLVVFCPCALALATPTSIVAAIGQATKKGVIIKSGEALEVMGKADCIAFDKTGTLTRGDLQVSDIISINETVNNEELISLAASVEQYSEHPLGKAITSYTEENLSQVENFEMIPGKGVRGVVNGDNIICGTVSYIFDLGIEIPKEAEYELDKVRKEGKASVTIAKNDKVIGVIALSDTIRAESKKVISELKEIDNEAVLLTGDNHIAAEYIAKQIGIKKVIAELLPSQKVSEIQKLQKEDKIVCMVGDGVNDAPALKTANVSVAMGGIGSDIAVEAADIALMGDNIDKLPYLKRLSIKTLSTIKVNITLSMLINIVAIILSLYGILNPVTGALVHNVGSVLVVLNAALLYDKKC